MHLSKQRVTVIGTGNAGLTTAYSLSKAGAEVCLHGMSGFDKQIDHIHSNGGIQAVKNLNGNTFDNFGFAPIQKLTKNIEEAVGFSRLLFIPVPSYAQEIIFQELLPFLHNGQILVLMPGNFGSLVLQQIKIASGYENLDITFVDAISIPWACRISGRAEIAIFGSKKYLPMATYPSRYADVVLPLVENALGIPTPKLQNVIQAGLENINFGAHPLLTILNMGLLENFEGNFNYYRDCCSKATANAAKFLDIERLSIGKAMGIELISELEAMNGLYGTSFSNLYDFNRNSATHIAIQGAPESSQHRYITEDVPFLMVPTLHLAQLARIDTPILEALIHLANAFNQMDYTQTGRTLQKMGLDGMTINQIKDFVSY